MKQQSLYDKSLEESLVELNTEQVPAGIHKIIHGEVTESFVGQSLRNYGGTEKWYQDESLNWIPDETPI